ncbi:MAG: PAS domain-containing protein [Proteobacteria bacterium]|nr:PAS domain-containing protein [Pseudomonadota bacterium]
MAKKSTSVRHSPPRIKSDKRLSPLESQHLIRELQEKQTELEQKNKELRRVQEQLEASRKKYADLYDFAPIGYFSLDKKGLIVEVNLTGANMLGLDRRLLINKSLSLFVDKDDFGSFEIHRTNVFKELTHLTCEIKLKRKDGTTFSAQLQSLAVEDRDGSLSHCRTAVIYLAEHRQEPSP